MESVPPRIRIAQPADSYAIALLHRREIPWGLLSQLGERFVASFYDALIRSPLGFVFVGEQEGRVVGFASGVVDWRLFYGNFLPQHLTAVARTMLHSLRHGRWRRLFETSRYAASTTLPAAELVSIAVEPHSRGTQVASELVRQVLAEFAARGVSAVRVTAGGTNTRAQRLYEKAGFTLHTNLEIHPGEWAAVYVKRLSPTEPSETPAPVGKSAQDS